MSPYPRAHRNEQMERWTHLPNLRLGSGIFAPRNHGCLEWWRCRVRCGVLLIPPMAIARTSLEEQPSTDIRGRRHVGGTTGSQQCDSYEDNVRPIQDEPRRKMIAPVNGKTPC